MQPFNVDCLSPRLKECRLKPPANNRKRKPLNALPEYNVRVANPNRLVFIQNKLLDESVVHRPGREIDEFPFDAGCGLA